MTLHTIPPVFDENSEYLILGSFPSVKSRDEGFFYAHPQNRFWRVMAAVFERGVPQDIGEKRELLLSERVALWDVIASCDIELSADSSIRNAVPNDVAALLDAADIQRIFVNGKTAERYYNRFLRDTLSREAVTLPSTSPANAAWSLEKLIFVWKNAILS